MQYPPEDLIQRPPVCYQEILDECLTRLSRDQHAKRILRDLLAYAGAEESANTGNGTTYGKQRRWQLKK